MAGQGWHPTAGSRAQGGAHSWQQGRAKLPVPGLGPVPPAAAHRLQLKCASVPACWATPSSVWGKKGFDLVGKTFLSRSPPAVLPGERGLAVPLRGEGGGWLCPPGRGGSGCGWGGGWLCPPGKGGAGCGPQGGGLPPRPWLEGRAAWQAGPASLVPGTGAGQRH